MGHELDTTKLGVPIFHPLYFRQKKEIHRIVSRVNMSVRKRSLADAEDGTTEESSNPSNFLDVPKRFQISAISLRKQSLVCFRPYMAKLRPTFSAAL